MKCGGSPRTGPPVLTAATLGVFGGAIGPGVDGTAVALAAPAEAPVFGMLERAEPLWKMRDHRLG